MLMIPMTRAQICGQIHLYLKLFVIVFVCDVYELEVFVFKYYELLLFDLNSNTS